MRWGDVMMAWYARSSERTCADWHGVSPGLGRLETLLSVEQQVSAFLWRDAKRWRRRLNRAADGFDSERLGWLREQRRCVPCSVWDAV